MSFGGKKIFCPYCNQESALKLVKKYDGFTLIGEVPTCGFCGHEFTDDQPTVLTEKFPDWAKQKGARRVCYLCEHYVVNPFVQKCVLREKEVEALDSCERFSPKPPPEQSPAEKKKKDTPPIF